MESKISRKLLLFIFIWLIILGGIIAFVGHMEMTAEKSPLLTYLKMIAGDAADTFNMEHLYWIALSIILFITGVLMWLTLRSAINKTIAGIEQTPAPIKTQQKKAPAPTPAQERKIKPQDDQRRALQMLCLLQREGRLVDFLEENLATYDDAQIGAAVRSIQENCQKTLKEHLALKAVIDQEEGEEITIETGFDANAIKLTGNVTGKPPFKGILQHRGWQFSKFKLPELSGNQDPKIIAPAEVEIP